MLHKCIALYVLDRWAVHATIDPIYCNASVDFIVPGKPNPPSNKLTATIWTQSRFVSTGTVEKYAIEWTDPSGKLVPSAVPLNTWVQQENFVETSDLDTSSENCIEGSPLVFKDLLDGDQKVVTLSETTALTITPFEGTRAKADG